MAYDWSAGSYELPVYQMWLTWVKQFQRYKAHNKVNTTAPAITGSNTFVSFLIFSPQIFKKIILNHTKTPI